jgi:4-hydroxy-3-methylbut-2-enyl diphosphate reductase
VLIQGSGEIDWNRFGSIKRLGITAGASAPEVLVEDVIDALRRLGPVEVQTLPGREENIEFRLPAQLAAS